MGIFNFLQDLHHAIVDIWETWRDKEENLFGKIIITIIVLGFLVASAKLWL